MGLLKIFDGQKYKPVGVTVTIPLEQVYPVGAVYISTVATDPVTLFGFGTWERIKDRFLLSAGDTYAAGDTGGEATHTLTEEELPNVRKQIVRSESDPTYLSYWNTNAVMSNGVAGLGYNTGEPLCTEPLGSGLAHNNMPPYLAVYMWKRTA